MNKRIIAILTIAILLTAGAVVVELTKPKNDIQEEIKECLDQNNYSYKVENGQVECNITEPTTTETTTTTTKKTTKKKTTKKVTMNVTANQKEMMDYALEQVVAKGWLKSEFEAVVSIVIKESSWNPNSVNKSSGACGLFQAYPCNKAIKQYPDYMTNYKSQIDWGLNYIKERYGTPKKAWAFWQEHHWY